MFEADFYLRLIHTSIVDIFKVFELLVCSLKGIWVHPYTATPAKLAPDLGIQVYLCSKNYAITPLVRADIHLRLLHTSIILDIYKVFEPLLCCLKSIWVHPYTVTPGRLATGLGSQGGKWIGNDVIRSCLRLISTSDCFIHPY